MEEILQKDPGNLSASELSLLEEEFSQWSQRAKDIKARLKEHQEFHTIKKAQDLRTKLKNIDSRMEEEREGRQALERQLQQLRAKESSAAVESESIEEELDGLELEHKLENIALLRLKAEALSNQRTELERAAQLRELELTAISEISDSRFNASAHVGGKVLANLLTKVDHLAEELGRPEYAGGFRDEIAAELNEEAALFRPEVDEKDGNQSEAHNSAGFAKLFDRVCEVRETRWEAQVRELEAELAKLCDERQSLSELEAEIDSRKHKHQVLMAKGMDFVVEMELGNAPPADFILQNMGSKISNNQEEDDAGRSGTEGSSANDFMDKQEGMMDITFDELLDRTKVDMERSSLKIKELTNGIEALEQERSKTVSSSLLHEKSAWHEPYDGCLGRDSYPASQQRVFDLVREIVIDFVDDSVYESPWLDQDRLRSDAQVALVKWQAAKHALLKQIEDNDKEHAVRVINDEMTSAVIASVIRGIYGEMDTARNFAQSVARKMIMQAVCVPKDPRATAAPHDSEAKRSKAQQTFLEMQKRRDAKVEGLEKASRVAPFSNLQRLSKPLLPQDLSVFYSTNSAYNADSMARIQAELDRRRKCEEDFEAGLNAIHHGMRDIQRGMLEEEPHVHAENEIGSDSSDDEADDDVGDITELDFGSVALVSGEELKARAPEFSSHEKLYWNSISFRSKHTKVNGRKYGTASCIASSACGSYLAVGTGLGSVLVFDLRPESAAVLVREYVQKGSKASHEKVTQLAWGLDSGSRLATIDEANVVRLFSTQPVKNGRSNMAQRGGGYKVRGFEKKKKFQPLQLELLLELSGKDFARAEQKDLYPDDDTGLTAAEYREKLRRAAIKKKKAQKRKRKGKNARDQIPEDLEPVHVSFHTAHTLFGIQNSLLVSLRGGAIVKWNLLPGKQSVDRSVFCPIHAREEPGNPLDASAASPGRPRTKGCLFGSTITREFFHAHKHPVEFIGHVNRSSEMFYSLDNKHRLKLWSYDPSAYTGFGWYSPSNEFHLKLKAVAYNADPLKKVEEVFPPLGMEVPKPNGADMKLSEDAFLAKHAKYLQLQEEELGTVAAISLHGTPWLTKEVGSKGRYMQIFAPQTAADDPQSSPHQVLIFTKGGILVKRLVSYFAPIIFHGHLCDMCMSSSGTELAFLVRYPGSPIKPATLKIFLYDTHTMQLEPTALEVPMLGKVVPKLALSPALSNVGSDYAYILMNNQLHCLSLTSGEYVCRTLEPIKNEPGVRLTNLVVTNDHRHVACIAATFETIYLFAIDDSNESDPSETKAASQGQLAGSYRPRLDHTFPECLI